MTAMMDVVAYGLGTLIALLLPYCMWALVLWTVFLVAWNALGIPLGT